MLVGGNPVTLLAILLLLSFKFGNVNPLQVVPTGTKEHAKFTHRIDSSLLFKKTADDADSKPKGMLGWFSTWKSKLTNFSGVPVPDTGNRYHIRIRDLNNIQGRHVSFANSCYSMRYITGGSRLILMPHYNSFIGRYSSNALLSRSNLGNSQ